MITLNDSNFEKEAGEAKLPLLVDFYADWCEPCRILSPVLEELAKELAGKVVFAKANVDENQLAAQKYGADRIPTVILFKEGKPVNGFVGIASAESIKSWLNNLL